MKQIESSAYYLSISKITTDQVIAIGRCSLADAKPILEMPGKRKVTIQPATDLGKPTFLQVLKIQAPNTTYRITRLKNYSRGPLTAYLNV